MLVNILSNSNVLNPKRCLIVVREQTALECVMFKFSNVFIGQDTVQQISPEDVEYMMEFMNWEVYYTPFPSKFDGKAAKPGEKVYMDFPGMTYPAPALKVMEGLQRTEFYDFAENITDFYLAMYSDADKAMKSHKTFYAAEWTLTPFGVRSEFQ